MASAPPTPPPTPPAMAAVFDLSSGSVSVSLAVSDSVLPPDAGGLLDEGPAPGSEAESVGGGCADELPLAVSIVVMPTESSLLGSLTTVFVAMRVTTSVTVASRPDETSVTVPRVVEFCVAVSCDVQ